MQAREPEQVSQVQGRGPEQALPVRVPVSPVQAREQEPVPREPEQVPREQEPEQVPLVQALPVREQVQVPVWAPGLVRAPALPSGLSQAPRPMSRGPRSVPSIRRRRS